MRAHVLGVIVLAVLAGTGRAAGGVGVRDGAGLFDRRTIEDAGRRIDSIRQEYDVAVAIETVPDLEGQPVRWSFRYQRQWLREQAQARADQYRQEHPGFHGLYVLIVQHPRLLVSVVGWPAELERDDYCSDDKRGLLRSDLEHGLAPPGDPNQGLLRALDHYRIRLNKSRRLGPSPLGTLPALTVVGLLAGLWLVLSLLRFRFSGGERPAPLYRPAMQGSLFGVPCAFWLYDMLYRGERPVAAAVPPPEPEPPAAEAPAVAEAPPGTDQPPPGGATA